MGLLSGVHGTVALILVSTLLFAEESGVPLPLVPGDILLIVAGLLIANGAISPWAFFPLAFVAVLGGVVTVYTWARLLGSRGLWALARRLRAEGALARASARLHSAGPVGITIGRLLPGTRVVTGMVAGALRIDLRVVLMGAIPAIVIWIGGMTTIGILVGVPAEHFLTRVQHLALGGVLLLVLSVTSYVGLRRIPAASRRDYALLRAPRVWRLVLALVIDAVIVSGVVFGCEEVVEDILGLRDPTGLVDLEILAIVIVLFYIVATRRGVGATAGEGILNTSYRRPRRRRRAVGYRGPAGSSPSGDRESPGPARV